MTRVDRRPIGAMPPVLPRVAALLAAAALCAAFGGCSTTRTTQTKRTATEQLLIATATDDAAAKIDLPSTVGKKTFLDTAHLDALDQKYVVGTVRDVLLRKGALLVPEEVGAEIIVELRVGSVGIDDSNSLVGIPSLTVPIPFSDSITTPELPVYRSQKQKSITRLALVAYEAGSRRHTGSSGAVGGTAKITNIQVLGIQIAFTDIPEKKGVGKKKNPVGKARRGGLKGRGSAGAGAGGDGAE